MMSTGRETVEAAALLDKSASPIFSNIVWNRGSERNGSLVAANGKIADHFIVSHPIYEITRSLTKPHEKGRLDSCYFAYYTE